MIEYEHFQLDNGLKVFLHRDTSTPMAVMNLVYNVGSRDEDEHKTGFAHLFEHLMFGGSKNIASYDEPLQKVGGENNAFTSPDITNYYITLPAVNIETAFWLESDRMLDLSFEPKVLEIQRKVVIEEFKQRYLDQSYGDTWLKMRPLAYKKHPYRWATIGKEVSHIENATLDDVKSFFYRFYRPDNATLVLAGSLDIETVKELSEKWFGPIPSGNHPPRNLPQEPAQTQARSLETSAKVPLDAIYKAYHIPGRYTDDYHKADLLSDILGLGNSSRLYSTLVREQKLFNSISANVTGSLDTGLLIINGYLNKGVEMKKADAAIVSAISELSNELMDEHELEKVKNQAESTLQFSEASLLNRAMSLAFAANYGNAELCNQDAARVRAISTQDILMSAKDILAPQKANTLFYYSKNK